MHKHTYRNSYLAYFLVYNFYYLSWAMFSCLISVYLMGKGYKAADVSLVVSISYLASLIAQPFVGELSDRYSVKKVNVISLILAMIGSALFVFSQNLILITINYALVLTVMNSICPAMEKIATASPYRYGKIRIWGTIGYAIGTQMAGLLYDFIAPSAIFVACIITIALAIVGLLGTHPHIDTVANADHDVRTRDLFVNKKYLIYLIITGLFFGVSSLGNTYIPSMLTHDGLSTSFASTLLSVAVVCEAPLVFFSYTFMDKLSNKTLIVIAYIMMLMQYGIYAFDTTLSLKVIATFIGKHPAGMLLTMINLKVVFTIVDKHQQITALAFIQTMRNLSSIVFMNIGGHLLDATSYTTMYRVCLMILIIGMIIVIFYRIPSGKNTRLFRKV